MGAEFRPGFLAEIQVEHGPVDLIGRFLRYADAVNRAKGVVLSFATLEELQEVNERNRESWKPLFPMFNPKLNIVPPSAALCLLGRNADGEVVSAQAGRLFCVGRHEPPSGGGEFALVLSRSGRQANVQERGALKLCSSASKVTGRVAFLGAVW